MEKQKKFRDRVESLAATICQQKIRPFGLPKMSVKACPATTPSGDPLGRRMLVNPKVKAPTVKAWVMKAVIKLPMTEPMAKAPVMKTRMKTRVMSSMKRLHEAP